MNQEVITRRARTALKLLLPAVAALSLVAAACNSDSPGPSITSPPGPSPRPSSTGKLTILSPKNGQVLHGGNVTLKVELKDATLVDITSTDLKPNEGHLHVIMDDVLVSMTSGLETVIRDVAPGPHLIKVEFVANDHAPFDPRVIEGVSFVVKR